jgi:hypothetical protein
MAFPSSFSGAVIERAKATPGISALCGNRIFKGLGPPTTPMPYIEVHEIANTRDLRDTHGSTVIQSRVQATVCAADDPTTLRICDLLEDVLTPPQAPPLVMSGQTVLYTSVSDDFLAPRDEISPGATPQFRRILQIAGVCQRNPY